MADVDEPVNQLKLVRKVANAIKNPVFSVADATEWAFTINDRAVAALAAEWEKEPDSEIPTGDDLRRCAT